MSFWGTLGKVLLKAAPIAAAFIPGVGPLASMAISGLTSGAASKLSGGSWKDALVSGGIGAGAGLVGGGALKGIGPSSGALAKLGAGAAGQTAGTGALGMLGNVAGNIGKDALTSKIGGGGETVPSATSSVSQGSNTGIGPSNPQSMTGQTAMPRFGAGNNPLNQPNQNNPNLADALMAGRQATSTSIFNRNRRRPMWSPMTNQPVNQPMYQ